MAGVPPFLGSGWSFPPTFSQGGADVAMATGVDDVHQSLQILLSTRLGERLMQHQFGCNLTDYLFEEVDQGLINSLSSLIKAAVIHHEPRIHLNRINIDQSDRDQGLLLISLDYTIRTTNSRYNMVYPFYIKEAISGALLNAPAGSGGAV